LQTYPRHAGHVCGAFALALQALFAGSAAVAVEVPQPAMVTVQGGVFTMGSERGDADERPTHPVQVLRPIAIQRFETSVEEFATFVARTKHNVEETGCAHYANGHAAQDPHRTWREPGFDQTVRHPVVCVSYEDAAAYARWLSEVTGRRFRLPSEAEWEYVAKQGLREDLPWSTAREACEWANLTDLSRALLHYRGEENFANPALYPTLADQVVPCDDRFAFTAPVGAFRPNALGVYDLIGNVWEWVADCAGAAVSAVPAYPAPASAQPRAADAIVEAPCVRRGIRGGAWHTGARYARASNRSSVAANARMYHLGFRLVEDLEAARPAILPQVKQ
jgi:formylglycine-generating enzyme